MDAHQRVYRFDRRIGSEREHSTTLEQSSPWVRTRRAPRSPIAVGEIAIARAVDRLHRGDHPERAESPEILFAHELHVLEPLPQLWQRHAGRRDRLERDAHRTVADRVDRDRQTRRRRARDVGTELKRIEGQNSAILGTLIWLLERRGLRAEGAVAEEFHVADPQPLIAIAGAHPAFDGRVEVKLPQVPDLRRRSGRRNRRRERAVRDPHDHARREAASLTRSLESGV